MRDILTKAILELQQAGCATPRLDAEVLLAHALGCERYEIYTVVSCESSVVSKKFKNCLERRLRREPVAYITGYKEFWSMPIKVTPGVLIPRPETETLVEEALKILRSTHNAQRTTILDLCTGSGCIAAALAKELPKARFVVSDVSEKALEIAKENLEFAKGRVTFIQSDLFEKITGKFDLIVSNPPYVSSKNWEGLPPEIKKYEPRTALDGGSDGLDFIRQILQDAPRFLKPDGWLILENGPRIQTSSPSLAGARSKSEWICGG